MYVSACAAAYTGGELVVLVGSDVVSLYESYISIWVNKSGSGGTKGQTKIENKHIHKFLWPLSHEPTLKISTWLRYWKNKLIFCWTLLLKFFFDSTKIFESQFKSLSKRFNLRKWEIFQESPRKNIFHR